MGTVTIPTADLRQYLLIKRGLSKNSVRHVLSRLGITNRWLKDSPPTPQAIEQFIYHLQQKGLKNNSINTYIFSLRMVEGYLKDRGLSQGIMGGLKSLPKNHTPIEILSISEIDRILTTDLKYGNFQGKDCSQLNHLYKTMTRFLAMTGCRYEEMVSLTWEHVDLLGGSVTFVDTKNRDWRKIHITEPLISQLKAFEGHELVFTSMTGHKVSAQNFSEDLKIRAKKASITKRVHPHIFRHSFCTHLLENGVEITRVATLVGHRDIQTTYKNYAHLADEELKRAIYRHPLVRKNMPPSELMKHISDTIKLLRLEEDSRFTYQLSQSEEELKLSVKIK